MCTYCLIKKLEFEEVSAPVKSILSVAPFEFLSLGIDIPSGPAVNEEGKFNLSIPGGNKRSYLDMFFLTAQNLLFFDQVTLVSFYAYFVFSN